MKVRKHRNEIKTRMKKDTDIRCVWHGYLQLEETTVNCVPQVHHGSRVRRFR